MAESLYQQLVELSTWARELALKNLQQFRNSNPQLASLNAWSICTESFMRAVTEWRLGDGDPTAFFDQFIVDSRDFVSLCHQSALKSDSAEATIRLAAFNASYVQLLLGTGIDRLFRQAILQPRRFATAHKRTDGFDGSEWDNIILQLAESGNVSEQFAALHEFMDRRKKRNHWEVHCRSMLAYRRLIEAAAAGDCTSVTEAIMDADRLFTRRSHGDITWGGGDIADRTVDIRLACMIKKAEAICQGITAGAQTPHRWRW